MTSTKREIIEDIMMGEPEPSPSSEPDYNDGSGVSIGATSAPSRNDLQNLMASINRIERREEACEELIRRCMRVLGECEGRLTIIENAIGVNKGMRV